MLKTSAHSVRDFLLYNLRWVIIIMLALCVVSGMIWYDRVYSNPERVFWEMIDNNLKTKSITRHITQTNSGDTIQQVLQLFFGETVYVNGSAKLSRQGPSGTSVVKTENIGTANGDYVRYTTLQAILPSSTSQPDTGQILNVWGKQDKSGQESSKTGTFLQEAILGIMPFGTLNNRQRAELISYIRQQNVFEVDFNSAKRNKERDRQVIEYNVSINPHNYARFLQKYSEMIGLGAVRDFEPANFEGLPKVNLKANVDIVSRQLLSLFYVNSNRREEFFSAGLIKPLVIPEQIIPLEELQTRLQSIR